MSWTSITGTNSPNPVRPAAPVTDVIPEVILAGMSAVILAGIAFITLGETVEKRLGARLPSAVEVILPSAVFKFAEDNPPSKFPPKPAMTLLESPDTPPEMSVAIVFGEMSEVSCGEILPRMSGAREENIVVRLPLVWLESRVVRFESVPLERLESREETASVESAPSVVDVKL